RNASVGLDAERLLPTFRLHWDVPGPSSALAVAQRFGISADIIERARGLLPEHSRVFEEVSLRLEAEANRLHVLKEALESERAELQKERARLKSELEKLRERDRKALSEEYEKFRSALREARREIDELRKTLKENPAESLKGAKAKLDRLESDLEGEGTLQGLLRGEKLEGEAPSAIAPGQRFFVPRLGSEVEVLEAPSRGKVRVAVGSLKLWLETSELRPIREPKRPQGGGLQSRKPPPPSLPREPIQTSENTLDVRGMRVEEAIALTEQFLDRLYSASTESFAFIIHGVGSGALRDAIRSYLAKSVYARSFRSGTIEEGGDKLTVVELR
ncbi:MAG: Smr/MutS family protein, partial [Deltaproteobacteria bacterium]|nr:Smr/MutS family protein [Deltaproteobacteria bacterium]